MQETSKYTVFNIREYLGDGSHGLGEDTLLQVLSEFSCKINPDVERFIKKQSVEFAKKQQSVTYLVFSTEDAELVGYFAITIKPITVNAKPFSNTVKRKIKRVSEFDSQTNSYTMSAYLIAQLGKNYTDGRNKEITGAELLELAWSVIEDMQYRGGGMVVFLEANNEEKLLSFYQDNKFRQFDTRLTASNTTDQHELVQLLRLL